MAHGAAKSIGFPEPQSLKNRFVPSAASTKLFAGRLRPAPSVDGRPISFSGSALAIPAAPARAATALKRLLLSMLEFLRCKYSGDSEKQSMTSEVIDKLERPIRAFAQTRQGIRPYAWF